MEPIYRIIISGDRNWSGPDLEFRLEWLLQQMPRHPDGKWAVSIIHGAWSL